MLEFVIRGDLVKKCAQSRIVEAPCIRSKHFVVVGKWEKRVPLGSEVQECVRQWADKLVVQVEPVIHTVVSD